MKSKVLNVVMAVLFAFTVQVASIQKTHALVGLIVDDKITKTVGGIAAGTGVVIFGTAWIMAELGTATLGTVILGVVYGPAFAALGLVILDDEKVVDFNFQPISVDDERYSEIFSREEILSYNENLPEINAIRKTMESEVSGPLEGNSKDFQKSAQLWEEYKQLIPLDAVKVAEQIALDFIQISK